MNDYWEIPDSSKYNVRVPIQENYLLWLGSLLNPNVFERYYFCDPRKAIERGASICRQSAMIIEEIWRQNGMMARHVTLVGHTVAEVTIDTANKIRWVLDPHHGVVVEHDISTLQEHPEIVVAAYQRQAGLSADKVEELANQYGPEGNYIVTNRGYCKAEAELYRLKWLYPLYLMAPFALVLVVLLGRRLLSHKTVRVSH